MTPVSIISYGAPACLGSADVLEGKFLQLTWQGREYLVFATPEAHRYHNQILSHFASDHGIAHRWAGQEQLEIDHPELRISGGGRFRLTRSARRLRFWDDSRAYGRFDPDRLRSAMGAAAPPWNRLSLEIR